MSTFESSSSFVAPAASRFISTTRSSGLRKTQNRNVLTVDTTSPTYHTVDSDEEEERIRVALVPAADEHYYSLKGESDEDHNNAISVTIQFGWIATVRNAFTRMKKSLTATEEKSYRRVLSAMTIFTLFFLVVMFGGSVTAANTMVSGSTIGVIAPPSGGSMRIIPDLGTIPIWSPPPAKAKANDNSNNVQPSPSHEPPSSVGRVARAASVTRRSMAPSEQLRGPVPISPSSYPPSPRGEAAEFVIPVNPPYGTMSAKFRLLYVYRQQRQAGESEKREHEHPDNLAALFNDGRV